MSYYHVFKKIKIMLCCFLLIFPSYTFASSYYISCYYYNSDNSMNTNNFSLQNHEVTGAAKNYYWALNQDSSFSSYTELSGRIQDGLFLENDLTYAQAIERCNIAIRRGLVLWPTKSTYRLYDMKASSSNFSGYEYPIVFQKENQGNAIKKFVIFGDSLSDTGNLKRWLKVFPEYPYWFGHMSNGLVWHEYLSNATKIPVLNWAYSGAQSDNINDISPSDFLNRMKAGLRNIVTGSMKGEVDRYLGYWLTDDSYQTTKKNLSSPQDTMFMIWIGGNDFLSKTDNTASYLNLIDHPESPEYYVHVAERATNNIVEQVKRLNDAGGYYFLVFNMPNLGFAPMVANNNRYDFAKGSLKSKTELSYKLTEIIQYYNQMLAQKIEALSASRQNNIHVQVVDVFSALEYMMQNRNMIDGTYFDYEFKNPSTIVDVGSQKIPANCYQGGLLLNLMTTNDATANQLSFDNTCKNADGSINTHTMFWDDEHPSTYIGCYFSYLVQNGLYQQGLIQTAPASLQETKNRCLLNSFEKN